MNTKPKKHLLIIEAFLMFLLFFSLVSCEDVIDVKLESGQTFLVVDGWVYNDRTEQTILLSTTAAYFSNTPTPRVTQAFVALSDDLGNSEILVETAPGKYQTQNFKGEIGRTYYLTVRWQGEEYIAESSIYRVPEVDSLRYEYKQASSELDEGVYIQYYGPELPGVGDFYRFKIYRNGSLLNRPQDLIYTSDEFVDGNYIFDITLNFTEPFAIGDEVYVEGLSISRDAYYYFDELWMQTNNGGLFARTPANVRSNIQNINPNSPKKAIGYFGASAVTSLSGTITSENGVIKR